jgi:hypothetical protein
MASAVRSASGVRVAKIEFELAELCLSHRIGNKGYNRTTMPERRARIMVGWANYVCGSDADNVIPLRAHERRLATRGGGR